jgi:Ca2+-transporting ATPase
LKGDMAAAVREGKIVTIAADELRMGDLVLIQTGDIVPADLKLLEASDLEVDEFELTGELMPVPKYVKSDAEVRVFQGSNVLRGHGKGVVIAAAEDTEYGRILKESIRYIKREKIPLIKKSHFALLLLLAPALLIRLKFYDNQVLTYIIYPLLAFLLLLLPNHKLYKSLVLRRQQKRLFEHNIVARYAEVLDDIRKVDVFCFDKTGVLTSRDIKVKEIYLGGGNSSTDCIKDRETWDIILTGCALCHDFAYKQTMTLANPVDRALISFAEENGVNLDESLRHYQRVYQKPFNSEDRYMACGFDHGYGKKRIYFAKGDPEVLLKKCNTYVTPLGERRSKDFSFLSAVRVKMEEMSHDGSVIIALACSEGFFVKPPPTYTFLCLLRLENPLRPDAKAVLRKLSKQGIRNVILTGDRTETAVRIGAKTGMENAVKFYLTGREIERMPLSEVARQSEYVSIFTRLSPSQKGIVARSFQQRGHGVAVIGDGTNDVIALKSADVGISFVERSSPMAKRAAKVLINDLTDILRLVETARHAHRQVGFIAVCIMLMFIMLLFGGYFFGT